MELSGAESVHSLNHRSCVFNGSLRQDAVAKIENMSGTIARTTQNPLDPRFNDLNGSEKCHGVQVPLDSHIMTKKRPGISQIRAPIHPYNIATRLLHQGKERGVAGSKMDGRNLLVNALEYALAVRIHIFLVVRRAECSDPTVKQLLGLQRKERIHILYRAHGIAYDRTFSFSKRQIHPHARKRQQDVCKDDGRVKVESPHGLEGDLSGEFRSPAHLQERAVSPQGPVLLQVPPCLSHHPNWRTVYLFPPAGL